MFCLFLVNSILKDEIPKLNGDITVSVRRPERPWGEGGGVGDGDDVRSLVQSDVWGDYSSDDLFSFRRRRRRSSSKGFVRFDWMTDCRLRRERGREGRHDEWLWLRGRQVTARRAPPLLYKPVLLQYF